MEISIASSDHIEYLSASLSDYFSTANKHFKHPKYRDDYNLMLKHVSKRISNPEEGFLYFVAQEDKEPVGFVNILVDENNFGSILLVIGESKDIKKALLEEAVKYFKERKVTGVYGEVMKFDTDSVEILKDMGMEELMISFILNT
jgi:hypothetical protein